MTKKDNLSNIICQTIKLIYLIISYSTAPQVAEMKYLLIQWIYFIAMKSKLQGSILSKLDIFSV